MAMAKLPLKLSAGWLRDQYRSGALTPEELIREIIRRSQQDLELNIWIEPPDYGRIQPYLEAISHMDIEEYPLWGIPFAVKDNIDVQGFPTTAACPQFSYIPDRHSSVVERLVGAGAIPVGKSNLDQFATGLVGTRSPHGAVHNALRPEYISGGSSSGSAVAVARGQAVFSLGTDTAGSGRVPAALNGLVGYKPSLGAWPTLGVVPACASLDCVTVFANSLEEALLVDRQVRGLDVSDPWSRSIPRQADRRPARLLFPAEPLGFYGPHEEEYRLAWQAAGDSLKKLGIPIEHVDCTMFFEAASILYDGPWVAERWTGLGAFVENNRASVLPVTEQILSSGNGERHTASSLFQAMHRLQEYKAKSRELLQDAVLVMPTCGGTWTREQVELNPVGANSDMGRYTNHCNLLDLSAVAVPAGDAAQDLPFGITFFALADSEHLLAGMAGLYLGDSGLKDTELAGAAETVDTSTGAAVQHYTTIAVCGLHMQGYPLEKQMTGYGAYFWRETKTAPCYDMIRLQTVPAKPGLIKKAQGGAAIQLELWKMPVQSVGAFAALIPAPLGLGKVELEDGSEVIGFICEGYAEAEAENITASGGWRYA
ncbi:allophanate hydrolase [Paenibacillus sp. FSL R7-0273]|uniref:allophanate hydrolase n=1 Tax=Paenibacillus sp. FSL R7-0273 TaxID=1536772 RepID=UPI0004F70124|nr:allophanate hydrolase [Paenibacillus sp. FSL R7-0273]AIQ45970.1 allophanate hydrolase [Paenibacillus sp. FSL R7-0273]OMF87382.1 allophanate hydrolase [Paenibacillus sp. FSL R7-0273]